MTGLNDVQNNRARSDCTDRITQYLPLRELEHVTSALNFDTSDCHVIGACELYTIKASSSDKKLYDSIKASLEEQQKDLYAFSASLSPPQADQLNLSLKHELQSPFGSLTEAQNRRAFAYAIATLNASHPDYDFSQVLRPYDFRRERSLRSVINKLDETIHTLRPRALLAAPIAWNSKTSSGPQTPGGAQVWGQHMWRLIDKEMALRECEIYCYSPDEDPFDGEEDALWSMNYLFFNKSLKRVCYIYLRGLSISSHSPSRTFDIPHVKRPHVMAFGDEMDSKRARYESGVEEREFARSGSAGRDRDIYPSVDDPEDDVVDRMDPSDYYSSSGFSDIEEEDEIEQHYRARRPVQGISEHIMESMDV